MMHWFVTEYTENC